MRAWHLMRYLGNPQISILSVAHDAYFLDFLEKGLKKNVSLTF